MKKLLLAGSLLTGIVVAAFLVAREKDRHQPVSSSAVQSRQLSQEAHSKEIDNATRRPSEEGGTVSTEAIQRASSLEARMAATRERALQERTANTQAHVQKPSATEVTGANEQAKLASTEFIAALREAFAKADPNEVQAVLERVAQDVATVEALKDIMRNPSEAPGMQRHAGEALLRIGSADSVQFVLDQIMAAYRAGDETRASSLLPALESPTTTAGMQALFDFLLGRGQYAQVAQDRPEELVNASRKALRLASDREAVGSLAASLYLNPEVMANDDAMWELFDGVSHPIMLAQLASRAYQEDLPDNAAQFLERLGETDDQGTVQALVEMVPHASVPIDDPALALYDWSLRHPQQALSGLFLQYVTDSTRPPEQRSVAALGLAGSADTNEARRALEKALNSETDAVVRTNLQTALTLLTQEGQK